MAAQTSGGSFVSEDTIFVTGLPEDTTEEQLKDYFGQIGIIKFDKKNNCPKIWIYKDKATGNSKGEATITYDDPPTAKAAITWFDGKNFRGATLKIELAQRRSAPPQFASRGGGRGGPRGGGGGGSYRNDGDRGSDRGGRPSAGSGRPGDWVCPECSNNNFAYRQECNRCKTQKPAGAGGGGGGGDMGGGGARGSHNNGSRYGEHRSGGGDRAGGNYSSRGGDSSSYHRNNNDRSGGRPDHRLSDAGYRDRGGEYDRHNRDRGGGDRDRSSRGGGPSRNHPRDDRRSRPY